MRVTINGRFTLQRLTGVQRHAREITRRLGSRAELVVPPSEPSGVRGHLWEQCRLPGLVGRQVLWSPCGTGPLSVRRQVITVHDTGFIDTPEYYSRAFAAWYHWLIPRLVRKVAGVIVVSEFTRQQLVRHFQIDPARITVVPNGIEGFAPATSEQVDAVRRAFGLKRNYLLYVGSLKPNKNLTRVLAAWEQTGLAARGLELAVVGRMARCSATTGWNPCPRVRGCWAMSTTLACRPCTRAPRRSCFHRFTRDSGFRSSRPWRAAPRSSARRPRAFPRSVAMRPCWSIPSRPRRSPRPCCDWLTTMRCGKCCEHEVWNGPAILRGIWRLNSPGKSSNGPRRIQVKCTYWSWRNEHCSSDL